MLKQHDGITNMYELWTESARRGKFHAVKGLPKVKIKSFGGKWVISQREVVQGTERWPIEPFLKNWKVLNTLFTLM